MLDHLERIGLAATRALSVAGLAALMVLACLTLADGLARWLANQPIEGVRDMGALAIAVAVACCIPVGLMERSNISLRFVEHFIGPRAGRICDAFAALAVALVLVLMCWQLFLHAGKLARAAETTWVLKIPVAPFWYAVACVFVVAVAVQLIVVALDVARALGRRQEAA